MAGIEGETLAHSAAAPQTETDEIDRRSLRRLDWRVLLPVPPNGFDHMVLLGGPDGLGGVMTRIGLAKQVSTEMPKGPVADAVAILHGAHVGCEEAALALLPGGSLYWELEARHRWAAGFGRSLKKRLRRSRLSLTGSYWVLPDFERGEVFVPIFRAAVEWYLRHWIGESSFRSSLISNLAPLAAWAGTVSRSSRACAVTAVAGPASDQRPSILEHPALSVRSRKDRLYPLVVNREFDATRRVIVFPFRAGRADPAAVLKFWRLPRHNADTQAEQKIIGELRSRLDPVLRKSIPAPLGVSQWGQLVVGAETCVPGKPLSGGKTTRERRRAASDLLLVTQWLADFHRQTGRAPGPFSAAQLQSAVEGPLTAYTGMFGKNMEEAMLFERARERAASLLGSPFPFVWSHPAFSHWNICRSGNQLSVMDWEGAEVGPPLRDLIYFATLWYYSSRPGRGEQAQLDSFRDLFFPSSGDRLAAAAFRAFKDYMNSLSIDFRFFPLMLVLTWVTHAESRGRRIRRTQGDDVDPRLGNLHVGRIRILAENPYRLFAEGKS